MKKFLIPHQFTMINEENFAALLSKLGFEKHGYVYEKVFSENVVMKADFLGEKLSYPEQVKNRDRNVGFDQRENFVVFECVNRLLEKGYSPEDIELEKQWHLGHDPKGGRADICVSKDDSVLFIIECKTWGQEFNNALKDTNEDGAQLFSYWQQERACKWLVLYASDFDGDEVRYKAPTINCSDDENVKHLAESDTTIKIYSKASTVLELFSVWEETYEKKIHDDLVFSDYSTAYNIGVKPLFKRDLYEIEQNNGIINQFEEILRHNNVSDKENAFNRLIALFICKLVDEINKADDDEVEFQYRQGADKYEDLQDRLQKLHSQGMEDFMREKIFYVDSDYAARLFSTYKGANRKNAIKELQQTIRKLKFYSNNDFAFKDVHNEELFYQNGKILVEMVRLFEKYKIVYPSKHQLLGDLFEQLLNKGFKQN
ncbi:MAG: type I restriction enzyme HsdR N-terminal domain-containing protein, partial [Synergistaceae bacterium]|nr:type I restriction enzyme HsdR N-terminal domain-containing protein [Synergistaceae bacterium]